jgi:glycosyltransferase involved in cell wall biosynthesis
MNNPSKNSSVDVALICPTLAGGLGNVTITLAETMRKRGISAEIWVLNDSQESILDTPVPIRPISSTRATFSLLKLISLINTVKPGSILSASYHLNCFVIIAKMISFISPHLVIAEHTSLANALETLSWYRRFLSRVAIATLYRFSDTLVAVSDDVARQMEKYALLPKNTAITIYNPVISDELYRKSNLFFSHPFFEANANLFLSVGRISKEKDFPTMIAAFAETLQVKPSRLIIAGDGPEMGMLEKLVEDLNLTEHVALLGHVNNPYPLYKFADVFVLSSLREGLPTVLIEALALGCKVVSTDVRSGPREILRGGALGKLVPASDIKSLAKAMIESVKKGGKKIPSNQEMQQYGVNFAVDRYVKALNLN